MAFSCASVEFLKSLEEHLITKLGVSFKNYRHPSNNGGSLQSGRQEDIKTVLRYIYQNTNFSMKRKKEKANAFLGGVF